MNGNFAFMWLPRRITDEKIIQLGNLLKSFLGERKSFWCLAAGTKHFVSEHLIQSQLGMAITSEASSDFKPTAENYADWSEKWKKRVCKSLGEVFSVFLRFPLTFLTEKLRRKDETESSNGNLH